MATTTALPPPCAQLWNMGRRDDLVVVDGLRGESFALRLGQHGRIGSGSGCEIRLTRKEESASSPSVACFVRIDEEGNAVLDHVGPRSILLSGVLVDSERSDLRHGDTIAALADDGRVLLSSATRARSQAADRCRSGSQRRHRETSSPTVSPISYQQRRDACESSSSTRRGPRASSSTRMERHVSSRRRS